MDDNMEEEYKNNVDQIVVSNIFIVTKAEHVSKT